MFLFSSDPVQGTWNSLTPAMKPLSHDRQYFFLPYWDEKPTMYIRSPFPDLRRRMYQSNVIDRIATKLDENLKELHTLIENEDEGVDAKLKATFEQVQQGKSNMSISRGWSYSRTILACFGPDLTSTSS